MYAQRLCGFRLDYELSIKTPLHVGGGDDGLKAFRSSRDRRSKGRAANTRFTKDAQHDRFEAELVLPIHTQTEGGWSCFVPGTSFRGALRHHLRRRIDLAIRDLDVHPAWTRDAQKGGAVEPTGDPSTDAQVPPDHWEPRFGNVLIRHIFGSEARRGAARFSRLDVVPEDFQLRYSNDQDQVGSLGPPSHALRVLTRNRLDRFTMSSTEGLRNRAALDAGTRLTGHIELDSFAWWQVGAVAVAMHDLAEGSLGLGTRSAVGMGQVTPRFTGVHLRYHRLVAPQPKQGGWPGIARCLAALDLAAPLSQQIWGRFHQDGMTHQMFLHDAQDAIEIKAPPDAGPPPATPAFQRHFSWSDPAVCREVMKQASRRLAAAAASLSNPPADLAEEDDA